MSSSGRPGASVTAPGVGRAPRVGRNAAAAGTRFVVTAALALAVTPYALEQLGVARFGLWALAGGVVTAVRLLDLGVGRALTREVAQSAEPAVARPFVSAALGLAVVTGSAAVAAVGALSLPLLRWLDVPQVLLAEAAIAIVGSALVAAIEAAFMPHAAALEGVGRTDLSSGVDTGQRVLSAVGVVAVLSLGWGLPGLVAKNAVLAVGAGLAYRHVLAASAPGMAGIRPNLRRDPVVRLLSFGRHIQAVNVGALLTEPINKLILGRSAGLAAVAAYELAALVVSQLGGAFLAAAQALYPEAARRAGAGTATGSAAGALEDGSSGSLGAPPAGGPGVGRPPHSLAGSLAFLRQAEIAVALPALGAFALLAALAGPFVSAWLSGDHAQVAQAIGILSLGWALAVIATPSFLVAQGGGRPDLATAAGAVTTMVSLTIAAALAGSAGAVGVAVGRTVGLISGAIVIWVLVARSTRRPAPRLSSVVAALAAAAVAAVLARWIAGQMPAAGLLGVAASGLIGLGTYGVLAVGARLARRAEPDGLVDNLPLGPRHASADCRTVVAVVPAWNARDRLPQVLDALASQVSAVVVVDNASGDGSPEWLRSWESESPSNRIALLWPDNLGYAAAINAGAERALGLGADALLLVNDDAVFEPGATAALCAAISTDPTMAAVSAKMLYADRPATLNGTGGRWDPGRAIARLRGEGEFDAGQYDQSYLADYPSGAASLIRADAWRDVGPMDETYYLYYEDVDWGLRARQRNWVIGFAPSAVVHHVGSAGTLTAPERRRYYNVRNRLAFAGRYAPWWGRGWAAAATMGLLAKQPVRWLDPARRSDAEAVAAAISDRLLGRSGRSHRFG